MNRERADLKIIGLVTTILLSVLTLITLGCDKDPDTEYFGIISNENNLYQLLFFLIETIPGITYSIYLSIFFVKRDSKEKLPHILVLYFTYFLSYLIGMGSLGLFNIISGGIGAVIINSVLPNTYKFKNWSLFFIGALLGLLGLIGAYLLFNPEESCDREKFILVTTIPWQIVIGILLIKKTKPQISAEINKQKSALNH